MSALFHACRLLILGHEVHHDDNYMHVDNQFWGCHVCQLHDDMDLIAEYATGVVLLYVLQLH